MQRTISFASFFWLQLRGIGVASGEEKRDGKRNESVLCQLPKSEEVIGFGPQSVSKRGQNSARHPTFGTLQCPGNILQRSR